ncbi:MAG: YegP family protein [Clostridia bacterium]|nr:YegP family protein [Clostridia bacterium]
MAGKFEIVITDRGTYWFNLKAGNGEVIAKSQQYASIASCKKGIDSVKRNAVAAKLEDQTVEEIETVTNPKFEIYADKKGEIRFRLKARNGEIIATGEGYRAKASCLKGVESIRRNAPDAVIVEPTE